MKQFIILFSVSVLIWSCQNTDKTDTTATVGDEKISTDVIKSNNTENDDLKSDKYAEMKFETTEFDFGVIHDGDKVEYEFEFTNTGTAPLLISETKVSCGCTVASYPREPIGPGESSVISVEFNSSGKGPGRTHKTITIIANTEPNNNQVSLVGEII